jgi:hypothetical protein
LIFIGGEMNISFKGSFSCMNSLKVIETLVEVKNMDRLGGSSDLTAGGVVSFGPPEGLPGRAHLISESPVNRNTAEKIMMAPLIFKCTIFCKDRKVTH